MALIDMRGGQRGPTPAELTKRPDNRLGLSFDRGTSLAQFDAIIGSIPPSVRDSSRAFVERAYDEWEAGPEALKGQANSAFIIHPRIFAGSHPALDDFGRVIPALAATNGIPFGQREQFWNTLPPMRLGKIEGTLPNGTHVNTALITAPITPTGLMEASRVGIAGPRDYAKPRIHAAVDLANKFGADQGVTGLGETLASLTRHGLNLQSEYPGNKFATGHAFTTLLIQRWIEEAARRKGIDLADANITILGAGGSIGRATLALLSDRGVGASHVTLFDKPGTEGRMSHHLREFGLNEGDATVFTGEENLKAASKKADIIVSGLSTLEPIVHAEHLPKGVAYVDDSQPPSVYREEADKAGASIYWVVGKLPTGMSRDFDYGLLGNNGEWGCAMEAVAMTSLNQLGQGSRLETVGPLTAERVKTAGTIADELGYELGVPQSFGQETVTHTTLPPKGDIMVSPKVA